MNAISNTLPREQRLKSRSQITLLFDKGERGFAYPVRYVVQIEALQEHPNIAVAEVIKRCGDPEIAENIEIISRPNANDPSQGAAARTADAQEPEAKMMVSVPKRLHKRANVRNLIKRRMREAYRLHKAPLREMCAANGIKLSLGLLYTSGDIADYSVIEHAVKKIIQTLVARS